MEKKKKFKINSRKFIYRFEPEIDGGTLFIYNFDKRNVLKSNIIGYKIIKSLEGDMRVNEIIKNITKDFPGVEKEVIKKDVIKFLDDIEKENLVYIIEQ